MRVHSFIYYILLLPGAFFAPVIHESVKAACSAKLGDPTPKRNGFLSRNPFKYFETVGFICMLIFGCGWGQPVPTSPLYYKNRKRGVLITYITPSVINLLVGVTAAAASGLLGNYLLPALLRNTLLPSAGAVPLWFTAAQYALQALLLFARCNIALAFFNIIPVFPLDGSKILQLYLKPDWALRMNQYEKIFQVVLIILMGLGFIGVVIDPLVNAVIQALI